VNMDAREADIRFQAQQVISEGSFSAPKDRAVFWSGEGSRVAANEFVDENRPEGWSRVEDTSAGRELDELIPFHEREELGISVEEYEEFWREASDRFSLSQEGDIKTFVENALEHRNFRGVEQDNLIWDGRVTSINGHDKTEIIEALERAEKAAERDGLTPDETRQAGQEAAFQSICETEREPREIVRDQGDRDHDASLELDQSDQNLDQSTESEILPDEIEHEVFNYPDPAPGGDWAYAADMEEQWSSYEVEIQKSLSNSEIGNEQGNDLSLSESFQNAIER